MYLSPLGSVEEKKGEKIRAKEAKKEIIEEGQEGGMGEKYIHSFVAADHLKSR